MLFNNNKIYKIDKSGRKKRCFWISGLHIRFKTKANNAEIVLHEPIPKFKNCKIIIGSKGYVEIGSSNYKVRNLTINLSGENCKCIIGKNLSATHRLGIYGHSEPNISIKIGDDCMFGSDVILRASDAHSIIDLTTNQITNIGKNIELGNHVWICRDVEIMKNINISDNVVIASKAIVTKSCTEPYSIYGGIPAKLIKSNVDWSRLSPERFETSNSV